MKNEVLYNNNTSGSFISEKAQLLSKSQITGPDYSTITIQTNQSLVITDKTESFDLYKGMFFMLCSCISKSCFSLLTKYLLESYSHVSSFQLLAYRSVLMFFISIALLGGFWKHLFPPSLLNSKKTLLGVIIRTIFAVFSISLLIYALKNMHVSDVYSLYYIYPAIILVLSLLFLKNEKFGYFDFICLFICFIGALLIVKPTWLFTIDISNPETQSKKTFFFLFVLIASCMKAVEDIIVRRVGNEVPALLFPFAYSMLGIIIFPLQMFLFDKQYLIYFSFRDWILIFITGILTYLYQFFMALGLQNEGAGRVSMVNYIQIALMYICDLSIFGKPLQMLDLLGTCLIFGFNFTNGIIKVSSRLKELNKKKNLI